MSGGLDLRGLPLAQEDAGEGELQRGRHHLLGQRLELELDVRLRRHGAGVLLHVDAAGGQGLPPARGRLLRQRQGERKKSGGLRALSQEARRANRKNIFNKITFPFLKKKNPKPQSIFLSFM